MQELQRRVEELEARVSKLEEQLLRGPVGGSVGDEPAPSFSPEKKLTKQQQEIKNLADRFRHYGAEPPHPALLALWRKKAGSYRKLRLILDELGIRGHLSKGHAYVAAAVLGEEQRSATTKVSGYKDGETLDTGYRWSAREERWVPPEQWTPA